MSDETSLPRNLTHRVMVGDISLGGGAPVRVQSMTNVPMIAGDKTPILDARGNIEQIVNLAAAGCEIARVSVPNPDSVPEFARVVEESPLPVVADIHFNHEIAIGAARAGAAKLRINPGNIGTMDRVDAVIEAAGEAGIPIRIGVNGGSLDEKWREKHEWPLERKLVASCLEYVEHFESRGFTDIVVSAKASDVASSINTYRLLSSEMPHIPLHLGVTEAGTLIQGTVKSTLGIGTLLFEGIGDTLRVSLTDDPVLEPEVGWEILQGAGVRRLYPELVSCPTCSRCQVDLIDIAKEVKRRLRDVRLPIKVAVMGCVVNGPGEAKDADIGVACGKDGGILFRNGEQLRKVDADRIVDALFAEIDEMAAE